MAPDAARALGATARSIALLASAVPAARAATVSPTIALREQ